MNSAAKKKHDAGFGTQGEAEVSNGAADVGTVTVAGREWATGLLWQNVDNTTKAVAEAKAMALSSVAGDFYLVRAHGMHQYGIGWRLSGHRQGMPSIAATLADGRDNLIGVFPVKDGYYFVAVRDGAVLATCDRFIADKRDAMDAFNNIFGNAGGWGDAFAPDDFRFQETKEVALDSLLGKKLGPKLVDVRRAGATVKLLGILLIGAAIVGGGLYYWNHLEQLRLQEELAEIRRKAANVVPGVQKAPPKEIPPPPWAGMAYAGEFVRSCIDEIGRFPYQIAGWKPTAVTCTAQGPSVKVVASLDREGSISSANWIRASLNATNFQASVDRSGPDKAAVSWNGRQLNRMLADLKTEKVARVQSYLASQFEEALTKVDISAGAQNDFYISTKFAYRTPIEPGEFVYIIEKVPGMTIEKIVFDYTQNNFAGQWSVEGSFHEAKPLPEGGAAKGRPMPPRPNPNMQKGS